MKFIRIFVTLVIAFGFFTVNAKTLTDQILPSIKPEEKKELTKEQKIKKLPLYDLGIASISSYNPDYPGSAEGKFTPIVVPTFTYRGKRFRSDGDGSRARLLNSEDLELSMSAGGNFPVNSRDSKARDGMKTLGQVVLLGPRLMYFAHKDSRSKLFFDFSLRTGFSIARTWRGWRGMGVSGDMGVNYRYNFGSFEVFTLLYAGFASYEYHKFFYGVDEQYATDRREAYNAKSGYLGTNLILAFTKRINQNFTMFAGGVLMVLNGHINEESPLFERDLNHRLVLGLKYTIFTSKKKEIKNYF